MNFTDALNTILKYGGHIRRSIYPQVEIFANDKSLYSVYFNPELNTRSIIVAELSGEDVMAKDWEVNILGKFVAEG
jgi:hypothetical protein